VARGIVRPFQGVDVIAALGRDLLEEMMQVGPGAGIGIFVNDETCAGMANENGNNSGSIPLFPTAAATCSVISYVPLPRVRTSIVSCRAVIAASSPPGPSRSERATLNRRYRAEPADIRQRQQIERSGEDQDSRGPQPNDRRVPAGSP
jgi:hypothetical protein